MRLLTFNIVDAQKFFQYLKNKNNKVNLHDIIKQDNISKNIINDILKWVNKFQAESKNDKEKVHIW